MLAFLLRLAEGRQINVAQKLGRFMQGQAHDAGKTARQSLDEHGAEALDRRARHASPSIMTAAMKAASRSK